MDSEKWIINWLYGLLLIPLIAGVNYIVDPYNMNGSFSLELKRKSNTNYTYRFKTNIIENGNFDTLMLGTSRIGVMNPTFVNKELNVSTFNFSAPASTTFIQHKLFLYALHFNNIKNVIYGIDFMAFNEAKSIEKDFKSFDMIKQNIYKYKHISNYDLYFNLDTTFSTVAMIYNNIGNKSKVSEQYNKNNGMREYLNNKDALAHGSYDSKSNIEESLLLYFNSKNGIYKNYKFSKKYLYDFKKTVDYCKKHQIKLWVYIPPMFSEHLEKLKEKNYFNHFLEFEKELIEVTDYVDFNGYNSITLNQNNYWDSSHLREELTPLVMKKVLHPFKKSKVDDFGKYINKNNILEHFRYLEDLESNK